MAAKNRAPRIIETTPADREVARARGRALKEAPTALVSAGYDSNSDIFTFELRSGYRLQVPRLKIAVDTIVNADPRAFRNIEIDEFGSHVWFPDIDEGVNPVGMFAREAETVIQIERGRAGG